ncbi:Uncharacterised protein [Vibrio cholerae]|nr:Uncharacterised protein [Vibrio cholerae]
MTHCSSSACACKPASSSVSRLKPGSGAISPRAVRPFSVSSTIKPSR